MTISSTTRKAGPFLGDGVNAGFPFAFKVFTQSDVLVARADTNGAESILTLGTDYSVSLNVDQNASPGGTVTTTAPLAVGYTVTLASRVPVLQPIDITNLGGFYPRVINDALDRATVQIQQLAEEVGRTARLSISTPDGVSAEMPPPVANRLIGWNETGTALVNQDPGSVVTDSSAAFNAAIRGDYASTALGKGASLVGLHDAGNRFTATDAEGALAELAARVALRYADRFSPWDYGASATTGADNQAAVQACFDAAVASGKQARVVLWGDWSISDPITVTNVKNLAVEGGNFTLLPAFPVNRYAFEFLATADRATDWLHVSFVKVECSQIAGSGGFLIQAGFKCTLYACQAQHFKGIGFRVQENFGSHEVMLQSCWAMEYLYADGAVAYTGPWTGAGFRIDPNDCKLDGCVSYFTGTPLYLDSQYNKITNCHFGTGICVLTSSCSFCSLTDNYFDMCELHIDDPWHLKIADNEFLHATTNANATFIKLKPLTAGRYVYGLQIHGNSFQNNLATTIKSIDVDTSAGGFDAGGIGYCNVTSNSFVNTTIRTTRQRKRLFQGPATSYAVTADQFPFGVVQFVSASFVSLSAGVAVAQGVNVSGNTVTLTLGTATSGTAHIEMDCNVE